jgi:hypothetical protein
LNGKVFEFRTSRDRISASLRPINLRSRQSALGAFFVAAVARPASNNQTNAIRAWATLGAEDEMAI